MLPTLMLRPCTSTPPQVKRWRPTRSALSSGLTAYRPLKGGWIRGCCPNCSSPIRLRWQRTALFGGLRSEPSRIQESHDRLRRRSGVTGQVRAGTMAGGRLLQQRVWPAGIDHATSRQDSFHRSRHDRGRDHFRHYAADQWRGRSECFRQPDGVALAKRTLDDYWRRISASEFLRWQYEQRSRGDSQIVGTTSATFTAPDVGSVQSAIAHG